MSWGICLNPVQLNNPQNMLRPKQNICVFQVSGWKKLGMVGRNNILILSKYFIQ